MADQTQSFHTPSFGDEEFDDIPMLNETATYPMQTSHELHMTDAFNWHQQPTSDSHMMSNQSYQMPVVAATGQQAATAYLTNADQLAMYAGAATGPLLQQHQPQIPPQMNVVGNNYMGQPGVVQQQPVMQGVAAIIVKPTGAMSADDTDALNDPNNAFQHPSSDPFVSVDTTTAKESDTGKKTRLTAAAKKSTIGGSATTAAAAKKKKDPNEPQKPVSAYALFFKDNQAAIKEQQPSAGFGDISKIVASLWETLSPENKNDYKKKAEEAKQDYNKAMAAYRANIPSQSPADVALTAGAIIDQQQQLVSQQSQINHISPQHQQQQQQIVNQNYQNYLQVPAAQATFANQVVQQQQINQNMIGNQTTSNLMNPAAQQQLHVTGQQQAPQQQNQFMSQQQLQADPQMPHQQMQSAQSLTCIRSGCTNTAIVSSDWEDEYCSNECVITHCRDVFSSWIHTQSTGQNFVV